MLTDTVLISSLLPALFKYNNNHTTMSNVIHSEEQKKTQKVKERECNLFSHKNKIFTRWNPANNT